MEELRRYAVTPDIKRHLGRYAYMLEAVDCALRFFKEMGFKHAEGAVEAFLGHLRECAAQRRTQYYAICPNPRCGYRAPITQPGRVLFCPNCGTRMWRVRGELSASYTHYLASGCKATVLLWGEYGKRGALLVYIPSAGNIYSLYLRKEACDELIGMLAKGQAFSRPHELVLVRGFEIFPEFGRVIRKPGGKVEPLGPVSIGQALKEISRQLYLSPASAKLVMSGRCPADLTKMHHHPLIHSSPGLFFTTNARLTGDLYSPEPSLLIDVDGDQVKCVCHELLLVDDELSGSEMSSRSTCILAFKPLDGSSTRILCIGPPVDIKEDRLSLDARYPSLLDLINVAPGTLSERRPIRRVLDQPITVDDFMSYAKVANYLKEHPHATDAEIAEHTGLFYTEVKRWRRLVESELGLTA